MLLHKARRSCTRHGVIASSDCWHTAEQQPSLMYKSGKQTRREEEALDMHSGETMSARDGLVVGDTKVRAADKTSGAGS